MRGVLAVSQRGKRFYFFGLQTDWIRVESTIHKLFDAQRQHPDAEPVLSREQAPIQHPVAQKSTLHSFWRLPQPPQACMATAQKSCLDNQDGSRCEDCERQLPVTDGMDIDMMAADECACKNCGRKVCDMCAVTWEERRCLACVST